MRKNLSYALLLLFVVAAICGCGDQESQASQGGGSGRVCPINKHQRYDNKDSIQDLQASVISAALDDDNLIALNILRQTMYALGQDMALYAVPHPNRSYLRNEEEKQWLQRVQKTAADDNLFSVFVLAILYDKGWGVPMDRDKAIKLWRQASDRGFGPASYSLGKVYEVLYQDYDTVDQDFRMAAELYRKACDWGVPGAFYRLGGLYDAGTLGSRQLNTAMGYWEKGAAMGHAGAQRNLGLYYAKGGPGVRKNPALGEKWLRAAAMQGEQKAISFLREYYMAGDRVGDLFDNITPW